MGDRPRRDRQRLRVGIVERLQQVAEMIDALKRRGERRGQIVGEEAQRLLEIVERAVAAQLGAGRRFRQNGDRRAVVARVAVVDGEEDFADHAGAAVGPFESRPADEMAAIDRGKDDRIAGVVVANADLGHIDGYDAEIDGTLQFVGLADPVAIEIAPDQQPGIDIAGVNRAIAVEVGEAVIGGVDAAVMVAVERGEDVQSAHRAMAEQFAAIVYAPVAIDVARQHAVVGRREGHGFAVKVVVGVEGARYAGEPGKLDAVAIEIEDQRIGFAVGRVAGQIEHLDRDGVEKRNLVIDRRPAFPEEMVELDGNLGEQDVAGSDRNIEELAVLLSAPTLNVHVGLDAVGHPRVGHQQVADGVDGVAHAVEPGDIGRVGALPFDSAEKSERAEQSEAVVGVETAHQHARLQPDLVGAVAKLDDRTQPGRNQHVVLVGQDDAVGAFDVQIIAGMAGEQQHFVSEAGRRRAARNEQALVALGGCAVGIDDAAGDAGIVEDVEILHEGVVVERVALGQFTRQTPRCAEIDDDFGVERRVGDDEMVAVVGEVDALDRNEKVVAGAATGFPVCDVDKYRFGVAESLDLERIDGQSVATRRAFDCRHLTRVGVAFEQFRRLFAGEVADRIGFVPEAQQPGQPGIVARLAANIDVAVIAAADLAVDHSRQGDEQVVARAADQQIPPRPAQHRVGAGPADNEIVDVGTGDAVVAVAGYEDGGARLIGDRGAIGVDQRRVRQTHGLRSCVEPDMDGVEPVRLRQLLALGTEKRPPQRPHGDIDFQARLIAADTGKKRSEQGVHADETTGERRVCRVFRSAGAYAPIGAIEIDRQQLRNAGIVFGRSGGKRDDARFDADVLVAE